MLMLKGEQIKELRKALEETLEEFGKRLGISPAAISRWEREERFPHHKMAVKLSELYEEIVANKRPPRKEMAKA